VPVFVACFRFCAEHRSLSLNLASLPLPLRATQRVWIGDRLIGSVGRLLALKIRRRVANHPTGSAFSPAISPQEFSPRGVLAPPHGGYGLPPHVSVPSVAWLPIDPDGGELPPWLHGHHPAYPLLRGSPPLAAASVLSASRSACTFSLAIASHVLKFRMRATPPVHRMARGSFAPCSPRAAQLPGFDVIKHFDACSSSFALPSRRHYALHDRKYEIDVFRVRCRKAFSHPR
jgi:hypothetical protein